MRAGTVPERVYFYGCDGVDDWGWGCVYRCAQTLLAAMGRPVPSLDQMMDMIGIDPAAAGRDRWIEPKQVRDLVGTLRPRVALDLVGWIPSPAAVSRMRRTHLDDFDRIVGDWRYFHAAVVRHLRSDLPCVCDDGVIGLCVVAFEGPDPEGPDGPEGAGVYTLADPHAPRAPVRTVSVSDFYRAPMMMALMLK